MTYSPASKHRTIAAVSIVVIHRVESRSFDGLLSQIGGAAIPDGLSV